MKAFLKGKHVQLRTLDIAYADRVADLVNDQGLTKLMKMGTFPTSAQDCLEEINLGLPKLPGVLQAVRFPTDIVFAVHDAEPMASCLTTFVGVIGLFGIDWVNRTTDTRAIIRSAEGESYGHEAHLLVFSYAFGKLNLNKVRSGYIKGHVATAALLKKLGFTKEGEHRAEVLRAGVYHNAIITGILRDEFYARFPEERDRFKITWRPKVELGRDTPKG